MTSAGRLKPGKPASMRLCSDLSPYPARHRTWWIGQTCAPQDRRVRLGDMTPSIGGSKFEGEVACSRGRVGRGIYGSNLVIDVSDLRVSHCRMLSVCTYYIRYEDEYVLWLLLSRAPGRLHGAIAGSAPPSSRHGDFVTRKDFLPTSSIL